MNRDDEVADFMATIDLLIDQWAEYLKHQDQRIERLEYRMDNLVEAFNAYIEEVSERKQPG